MLSVRKLKNQNYIIYKFCINVFGEKPLFSIIFDNLKKNSFIMYETKEYLQTILNIRSFKELDEVSKLIDKRIKEIVRKYIKRNIYEIDEIEKNIEHIKKELEEFLKDFLLLQSI